LIAVCSSNPPPFQLTTQASDEQREFVIKAVQLHDLGQVAAVITESFHPSGDWSSWFSPLLRLAIQQDLRMRVQDGSSHSICLAGIMHGKHTKQPIVGVIEVAVRCLDVWQDSRFAYVSNLAVRPDYRRQGLGQQLLLACEQQVAVWGLRELYLHVLENNQSARQLYSKLGYRLHIADTFYLGMLLGQPRRLLLHKHF
jgi:ribosomal protein S18 acetylase RimI-like enzyme